MEAMRIDSIHKRIVYGFANNRQTKVYHPQLKRNKIHIIICNSPSQNSAIYPPEGAVVITASNDSISTDRQAIVNDSNTAAAKGTQTTFHRTTNA